MLTQGRLDGAGDDAGGGRSTAGSAAGAPDGAGWAAILTRYRTPSNKRGLIELAITAGPFVVLWLAMWATLDFGYWFCILLGIPAAGFLVRLFLIQHDCGHGAFFRQRAANDWTGRIIGVLTLTPYDVWRRTHAIHHASSGNLARRGIGDVHTLTLQEYRDLPWWGKIGYRLYRHPAVMFGFGPIYLFFLQHRFPMGLMGWRPWLSAMGTNVAIAAFAGTLMWFVGVRAFLLVHLPITLIGAFIGVWLFYVQHQFEGTFWAGAQRWSLHEAALRGSAHYALPGVLRWFTANNGVHTLHHLCSRIPYYRYPEVLRDHPELAQVGKITLRQSLRCLRLALWDETRGRLVSFREAATAG